MEKDTHFNGDDEKMEKNTHFNGDDVKMEKKFRLNGDVIKKVIKLILKITYQILVLMCLILTIIIVLQKITDSNKSVLGYRIFRVVSGSMEPEYEIGEVVISKEINPEDIKIGDDIVYLGEYGEYNGKIIMHEVIQIDRDEDNNLNFHAKGLHNASVEDPRIKPRQIYGVVKFRSDILTLLYRLAVMPYSSFIIVVVLALNVFFAFYSPKREKALAAGSSADEEEEN